MSAKNDSWKLTWSQVESEKDLNSPFRLNKFLALACRMRDHHWNIGQLGSLLQSLHSEDALGYLVARPSQLTKEYQLLEWKVVARGDHLALPLLHLKGFPRTPLSKIDDTPGLKILSTQLTHLLEKPLCLRTCKITWCSMLSKAFSKSSFKMTISFLEWWQRWKNYAQSRQYWMVLSLMKPYYLHEPTVELLIEAWWKAV